jgi:hypothetical protein
MVLGGLAALLAYAAMRAYDVMFVPEPDPATVVPSARVAYYWRLATAAYVALTVAGVGLRLPRDVRGRAGEVLLPSALVALAVQVVFFP